MAEEQTVKRHDDDLDHEVWLRCFTAALQGVFAGRASQARGNPETLMRWCATIADAALDEERRRRKGDEPSVYENRGASVL